MKFAAFIVPAIMVIFANVVAGLPQGTPIPNGTLPVNLDELSTPSLGGTFTDFWCCQKIGVPILFL